MASQERPLQILQISDQQSILEQTQSTRDSSRMKHEIQQTVNRIIAKLDEQNYFANINENLTYEMTEQMGIIENMSRRMENIEDGQKSMIKEMKKIGDRMEKFLEKLRQFKELRGSKRSRQRQMQSQSSSTSVRPLSHNKFSFKRKKFNKSQRKSADYSRRMPIQVPSQDSKVHESYEQYYQRSGKEVERKRKKMQAPSKQKLVSAKSLKIKPQK